MGKSTGNRATTRTQPVRSGRVQLSAPEITVRAQYPSAIGVDVHLNLLVCCFMTQIAGHQELQESRDFHANRKGIDEFAAWCRAKNPAIILMESTGVLWLSPYEALEDVGFTTEQLALINARDAKAAIGRKTDRKDAARLAELARSGHFKKSYIPPKDFRAQRVIAREIQKNTDARSQAKNRHQKMLNMTGCRASTVFSNVFGKAAGKILKAKINGATDAQLLDLATEVGKRLRASPEEIVSALSFVIPKPIAAQLLNSLEKIDYLTRYDEHSFALLAELQAPYADQIKLLMSIPGIKERSARMILAECGPNLKKSFPTSETWCSWIGLCPGDNTSAGKQMSGRCPRGNRYLRRTLVEIANVLALRGPEIFRKKYRKYKMARGHKRAIVALAHFLARVIYSVLTHQALFKEHLTTEDRDLAAKRLRQNLKQISRSGGKVMLQGAKLVDKYTGEVYAKLPVAAAA